VSGAGVRPIEVGASIPIGWRLRLLREIFMRQPIGMLGRSSGNHDWLLANASDCVRMETGL